MAIRLSFLSANGHIFTVTYLSAATAFTMNPTKYATCVFCQMFHNEGWKLDF